MAKTPLFHTLRRVAAPWLHVEPAERVAVEAARVSRRGLLHAGVAGLVGCSREPNRTLDPEEPAPHRIAVIGAGLAGLHCAYRLFKSGADVTVYDGNARVGGRVFSARKLFRDHPRLVYELGGEFIDTNHQAMLALIEEFDLDVDDRMAGGAEERKDVVWLGGEEIHEDVISEQFERIAPAIRAALRGANDDAAAFRALDNTTLAEFLELNVPSRDFPELSALLRVAFRSELGLEPDEQSALNLMFLVGSPDLASFRVFGASDRRVRVRAGNSALVEALEKALGGATRVKLDQRLVRVASLGSAMRPRYELSFVSATGVPSKTEAERVVFAIPFSVLDRVDLEGLGLSSEKRAVIRELGYGKSSKLVGAFAGPIWRDLGKSGSVFSDLGFQELWDSSTSPAELQGVLTSLTGGNAGARADLTPVPDSMAALLTELEPIFNLRTAYLQDTAVRMHWPSAPLFRGSNACLTPGQWARRGVLGRREGNLHFCGEHCSLDFPGRMEGAAETSALVAAEILDDLELAWPAYLAAIMDVKSSVPQPCYDDGDALSLGILERLALVARAHAP